MKVKATKEKTRPTKKKGPLQKKSSAKGLPEHIYNTAALASLRIGLRAAARRRKLLPEEGDGLLWRLSGPLKALENLYQSAKVMFAGASGAEAAFRNELRRLIDHAPEGNVNLLRQRTGLPNIGSSEGGVPLGAKALLRIGPGVGRRPGLDCSVIRPEGMAMLYLATLRSGLGKLTQPGLDTLATLSIEQGRMEGLSGALVHGGPASLEAQLKGSRDFGMPGVGKPGDDPGRVGYQPDPDNPFGPDDPWGPGGRGGWQPLPPDRGSCQDIREACEAIFIEHANTGLPPIPMPPRSSASVWSDNIDFVQMLGQCAGDLIIIHGQGFGSPKPPNVQLVMNVNGTCAVVQAQSWTDTRIEVILPAGIRSGPIGFYNQAQQQAEVDRYNNEVDTFNSAARGMMTASKCMGQPLDFNLFSPIPMLNVPCAPEGENNFVEAGLPVIHYFHATTDTEDGTQIVVEPGEDLVLRWNLENADTIVLTQLTPAGLVIATTTIDADSSSFEMGPPSHTDFDMYSCRLRATNECGTTEAIVRIIGSKRPGLAIQRIEVTQGIQTLDADVKLVAGKPTVVRTYITHALDGFGDNIVPLVKGSLSVYSSSGIYKGSFYPVNGRLAAPPDPPAPDINASITVQDLGDPPPPGLDKDDTLNFVIPASLCTETLDLRVSVGVDSFGPPGQPGFSDSVSAEFEDFTFHSRKPVKLRFIPVTIVAAPPAAPFLGFANPPTDQECTDFLREMLKMLPVTPGSIERLDDWSVELSFADMPFLTIYAPWGPVLEVPYWRQSLTYDVYANVYLWYLATLRLCEWADGLSICTEDQDAIWAVLVPVSTWGEATGSPSREFTASMIDVQCAHELAHCLDQQHLKNTGCAGENNGENNPNTGFDAIADAANWGDFDGGRILEAKAVPFDIIQNRTITDGASGVWDLMTYCGTRWTTPRRWKLIFDYVGS